MSVPAQRRTRSRAEVAWLRRHALPLRSDQPGPDMDDLDALRGIVQDARVVALGECTHGTHEFLTMRHRLTRWLVECERATVVVLEAGMMEASALDQYVQTGVGDPELGISTLAGWCSCTREMLDLVHWMRAHNASGRGPVALAGVDVQVPYPALAALRSFLVSADLSSVPAVDELYRLLQSAVRDARPDEALLLWRDRVASLRDALEARRPAFLRAFSAAVVDRAMQCARLLEQAPVRKRIPGKFAARDRSMADNLEWILERQPAGARAVFWAHNFHVSRAPGRTGEYLARSLGEGYRPVALAFGEGDYSAFGPEGPTPYPAPPPPPGTVEHACRAVGTPLFAVDLRVARDARGAAWFRAPHPIRSIGAYPRSNPFSATVLASEFDALVYLDRTTPTHLIAPAPHAFERVCEQLSRGGALPPSPAVAPPTG